MGFVNLFQRRILVGENLFGEITKQRNTREQQAQDSGEKQSLSQFRRTDKVALIGVFIRLGHEAGNAVVDKIMPDRRLQGLHVLAQSVGLTEVKSFEAETEAGVIDEQLL